MEGKKRYVAIVLFLLIGLTLFAFANPIEEEKGSKGNGSKEPFPFLFVVYRPNSCSQKLSSSSSSSRIPT